MRKRKSNLVLPWEEKRITGRKVLWVAVGLFLCAWIILGFRVDIPHASAGISDNEAMKLRREEVKNLKRIADSLEKIERKMR